MPIRAMTQTLVLTTLATVSMPAIALEAAVAASARPPAISIAPDDYRLFCGYLDALEDPAVQKLSPAKRDAAIAKRAKVKPQSLLAAVDRVDDHGATCDEVARKVEASLRAALDAALPGRVDLFVLDASDPSHVVVQVRWVGADKMKLVEEASLVAKATADHASLAKTVALRAVRPTAPDRDVDEAIWFEARTSPVRATNIDVARVADFANTRYIRVFDGVRCAPDVAAPTALGYPRGPCAGRG